MDDRQVAEVRRLAEQVDLPGNFYELDELWHEAWIGLHRLLPNQAISREKVLVKMQACVLRPESGGTIRTEEPAWEREPSADLAEAEQTRRVWAAARQLKSAEREVLYYRLLEESTLREAGRRLGITKERVRQRQRQGERRLRRLLQEFSLDEG